MGRVTDATGGVLPGATVTVVNLATNVTTVLTTNATGQYAALYQLPGSYTVTVELSGFRRTVHENVVVRVGDKVALDVKLSPGGVTEDVVVVAERPLLDSGTGALGQLVDSRLITELPLGDGTAYSLTRLVAGTTFEGGYALQRPMDNGNLFSQRVGGTGRSEFSLDGSSNVVNVSGSPALGISPPTEAIEEFKFETAAYDAQIGHTGAGAVNLALKSGSNTFHGATYYFNRDDSRSANDFGSNAQGLPKPPRNYYRYGATVSGPIAKEKTFFLVSFESLNDLRNEPFVYTVPTERMRNGDFSELLNRPTPIRIYDPATAQLVNGVVTRQPFPGNIIPQSRLSPVARNVLGFYPLPNRAALADGTQNYFVQQPWDYKYNFQMVKLDHQWTGSHRSYLRFSRNTRDEERGDFAGVQQGVEISRGIDTRYNYNVALGHTATLSPTLVLDVKAAFLRFASHQRAAAEVDLAALGFSPGAVDLFDGYSFLPRFNIDGVVTMGTSTTAFGAPRRIPFYNYSFNPTLTKLTGAHTVRTGYDLRMLRENRLDEAYKAGQYGFTGAYTRQTNNTPIQFGQSLAQFLLGIPTTGTVDVAASRANQVVSHGVFVQDDWRVSSKLTLNLGLRYDYEQPLTERFNRNTRSFDFETPNPIQAQAQARYAANPPAGIPLTAAEFGARVVGGYQYLSNDQRGVWEADRNNLQPRVAFAYKADEKTVLRGGAGLFVPLFEIGGNALNQTGFSRSTSMNITPDQGLTFNSTLSDPLPGGLLEPIGSSLGLRTNLGNNVSAATTGVTPLERKNAQYWRYSLGAQRELPGGFVVEVSYVGQKGQNLSTIRTLNGVPQQFLSTSRTRDNAVEAFLSTAVANPFQGLLPDAPGVNGATIPRNRLLAAFPQFGILNAEANDGTSSYHAGLFSIQKRFAGGSYLLANYTYSRFRERITRLNPWDELEERVSGIDRPHRVVLAGILAVPFGKDRRWGAGWTGAKEAVLGGWQVTFNNQFQSGEPLTWGNVYWDAACGDPADRLRTTWGHDSSGLKYGIDTPAFDTSCFYTQNGQPFRNAAGAVVTFQANEIALGNNVRYFPTTLRNFRGANHYSVDIGLGKAFRLRGGVRLEVRAEAINALNYTIFRNSTLDLNPRNAGFGRFSGGGQPTVVLYPRDIQLGARVTF